MRLNPAVSRLSPAASWLLLFPSHPNLLMLVPSSSYLPPTLAATVDEAILTDMFPPGSASCDVDSGTTTHTFEYTPAVPPSDWNPDVASFESTNFVAEMSHVDPSDDDRSWTTRIGTGGSVYSFRGPYGEASPPQPSNSSAWVDDVPYMGVAIDLSQHLKAALPNPFTSEPYFIHQAGTYGYDTTYNMPPGFYSPSLAKHCEAHVCSFAGWGQQAHVPQSFRSGLIYLNRYRNCGDGTIEVTHLQHNDGEDSIGDGTDDYLSYLNTPWGGIRPSVLHDIFVSDNLSGNLVMDNPPNRFGSYISGNGIKEHHLSPNTTFGLTPTFEYSSEQIPNLDVTGGITAFRKIVPNSQINLLSYSMPCHNGTHFKLKCNVDSPGPDFGPLRLTVQEPCQSAPATHWSTDGGTRQIIRCKTALSGNPHIVYSANGNFYFRPADGSNGLVNVPWIVHWSYKIPGATHDNAWTWFESPDATAEQINAIFYPSSSGKEIEVMLTDAAPEDSYALAYVHGKSPRYGEPMLDWFERKTRIRYGQTSRDYVVFTVNPHVKLNPSRTFVNIQFLLTGRMSDVQARAIPLVSETYEEMMDVVDFSGRTVGLYSYDGGAVFGAAAADSVGGTDTTCLQGTSRCVGKSTPYPGYKAFFAITCAGRHYFGSDQYHFAPDLDVAGAPLRPYACEGEPVSLRPGGFKLLGFFDPDDAGCIALQNAEYDPLFCTTEAPSESPSAAPTPSPSAAPSESPSAAPSESPSAAPSESPSAAPSPPVSVTKSFCHKNEANAISLCPTTPSEDCHLSGATCQRTKNCWTVECDGGTGPQPTSAPVAGCGLSGSSCNPGGVLDDSLCCSNNCRSNGKWAGTCS